MVSDKIKVQFEEMSHSWIYNSINVISYAVIFLFVYLLWKAQSAISVTDNARKLMKSILKTRKIIKYYVLFNIFLALISFPIVLYLSINEHPEIQNQLNAATSTQLFAMSAVSIVIVAVFLLFFWLFYKLIYGILIKRLTRNYNELKKLEV